MTTKTIFPFEQIDTENPDFNLIADYLEISAFLSQESTAYTKDLINIVDIGSENDYSDVDEEMMICEAISSGTVERIERRVHALGESYPFDLDDGGYILKFTNIDSCYGRAAYMLSLILSNTHPLSVILNHPDIRPEKEDIDHLRKHFQSISTIALAAEIHGRAWSFGFPRSDHSGFHKKLHEIWRSLKDGKIRPATGAPARPKDDQIDVFAARPHRDGLPGFLFAAAQVATGKQWKEKSIRDHMKNVFYKRWFGEQPVTEAVCYHIIPFDREDEDFVDDCRTLGNVLHRLRVPARVAQARAIHEQGIEIESYDTLDSVVGWLESYSDRCKAKYRFDYPDSTISDSMNNFPIGIRRSPPMSHSDSFLQDYPRDMRGYGRNPPHPCWPKGARIAVQFVINYEEGGENCILHGDPASETFLSEIIGAQPFVGQRHLNMESFYEFGSRAGFWRLHRLFTSRDLPVTVYGVAMALARNPEATAAMVEAGWEIASHGWRWIDYQNVDIDTEREHLHRAIEVQSRITGERPLGWYTGRCSPFTRQLIVEEGGFVYDSDSYADDLPYWTKEYGRTHLIIPYTLDNNDMRFATAQGFNSGDQFFAYLKDSFDVLYAEGADSPKMMSIGLHCRLAGRPGRTASLARFLDYIAKHDQVWICRRIDIARHWQTHHPCP